MESDGKRKKVLLQSMGPIVGQKNGMRERCYRFITPKSWNTHMREHLERRHTHTHTNTTKLNRAEWGEDCRVQ